MSSNKDTSSGNPFDILQSLKFSDESKKEPVKQEENHENSGLRPDYGKYRIRIWLEKKGRGGKTVSVIKGLDDPDLDIKSIAKHIKNKMGVGGGFGSGMIIIQGQNRDKIIQILKSLGFKNIKKAGG